MEIAIAGEVQVEERKYPTRPGLTRTQPLLSCEGEDGLSFRLIRSQYQGGGNAFETPRHHHAFQQIRFAERGSLNYAPEQNIAEGDIAFFPRGAYYGPQVRDHGVGLTVQFGVGVEMLGGKDSLNVYRAGVEKLRTIGDVCNGTFTEIDSATGERRERDTWEAVTEVVTGKPFRIPPEGYDAPILMHAGAFGYYQAAPGVEMKRLGSFFDHHGPQADVRISMLRLSEGGEHRLGADRAQLAWSVAAGLRIDDRAYPELTCLYSPLGEEAVLSGVEPFEVHVIEFPRLG